MIYRAPTQPRANIECCCAFTKCKFAALKLSYTRHCLTCVVNSLVSSLRVPVCYVAEAAFRSAQETSYLLQHTCAWCTARCSRNAGLVLLEADISAEWFLLQLHVVSFRGWLQARAYPTVLLRNSTYSCKKFVSRCQ